MAVMANAMIQEVRLWGISKARLWLCAHPDIPVLSGRMITRSAGTTRRIIKGEVEAAIEILMPMGASLKYGLLGGKWVPGDSPNNMLTVTAIVAGNQSSRWQDSMALGIDETLVGLDPLYADEAISAFIANAGLVGSGTVVLNRSCQGRAGSSGNVFAKLGKGLALSVLASAGHIAMCEFVELLRLNLNADCYDIEYPGMMGAPGVLD